MSAKLIICRGLPASGKTTWAKEQVREHGYKRINRDELRAMIDPTWTHIGEKYVVSVRDLAIAYALDEGFTVISDDTNLAHSTMTKLMLLAQEHKAAIEFKDFLDVSLETCISRDAQRTVGQVGETVIRDMYQRWQYENGLAA